MLQPKKKPSLDSLTTWPRRKRREDAAAEVVTLSEARGASEAAVAELQAELSELNAAHETAAATAATVTEQLDQASERAQTLASELEVAQAQLAQREFDLARASNRGRGSPGARTLRLANLLVKPSAEEAESQPEEPSHPGDKKSAWATLCRRPWANTNSSRRTSRRARAGAGPRVRRQTSRFRH